MKALKDELRKNKPGEPVLAFIVLVLIILSLADVTGTSGDTAEPAGLTWSS